MSYRDCSFGKVLYKYGSLICLYSFSFIIVVITYTPLHPDTHVEDSLTTFMWSAGRKRRSGEQSFEKKNNNKSGAGYKEKKTVKDAAVVEKLLTFNC